MSNNTEKPKHQDDPLTEAKAVAEAASREDIKSVEEQEKTKAPVPDYVSKVNEEIQNQMKENDETKKKEMENAYSTDSGDVEDVEDVEDVNDSE